MPQKSAKSGETLVEARSDIQGQIDRGQCRRRLWWRLVAILTVKSFVVLGESGERLIEPSSSWFPRSFPQDDNSFTR